jgi:hypothetical protein
MAVGHDPTTDPERPMITCFIRYTLDPDKVAEFETYAKMWLELVPRFGGTHHGYFLPGEGASDTALALFSFPNLAEYENYRKASRDDPEVAKALDYAKQTRSFLRYDRSFFRPVLS